MAEKGEPYDLKPKDKKKKAGARTSKPEDDDQFLDNSLEDVEGQLQQYESGGDLPMDSGDDNQEYVASNPSDGLPMDDDAAAGIDEAEGERKRLKKLSKKERKEEKKHKKDKKDKKKKDKKKKSKHHDDNNADVNEFGENEPVQ